MMAGYYLIQRLDEDMQANPAQYRPELRERIHRIRQELEGQNLLLLHRQNLTLLHHYAAAMEETVTRLNLNADLKRRLVPGARRERLLELRRQRLPSRPAPLP
jgi:hypothetical protein